MGQMASELVSPSHPSFPLLPMMKCSTSVPSHVVTAIKMLGSSSANALATGAPSKHPALSIQTTPSTRRNQRSLEKWMTPGIGAQQAPKLEIPTSRMNDPEMIQKEWGVMLKGHGRNVFHWPNWTRSEHQNTEVTDYNSLSKTGIQESILI